MRTQHSPIVNSMRKSVRVKVRNASLKRCQRRAHVFGDGC
jgi:hypothetical protein